MATQGCPKVTKPKTRNQSGNQKMREFVGKGKEFDKSEVPTIRAVIQQGLLIKENWIMAEEQLHRNEVSPQEIASSLAPLILAQWQKSNAKFIPPVTITEKSLLQKVLRLWKRVDKAALGNTTKAVKAKVEEMLDTLLDITTCSHTIMLCSEPGSGCLGQEECKIKVHIQCSCILPNKLPVMELEWLYVQRKKKAEQSDMKMGDVDWIETEKQVKAANNKAKKKSGTDKQVAKQQRQEAEQKEREEQARMFMAEVDIDNNLLDGEDDDFVLSPQFSRKQQGEIDRFVDSLLDQKIGKLAHLVVRYLDRPGPKRNTMPLHNTAKASLRCGVSPSAAATIASEFLKDLIAAGHLDPDMAYLACDPSKLYRARKAAMEDAREQDLEKHKEAKIVGMGYDGRKDKHTRAMVEDSHGMVKMRMIKEEHIAVTEEPVGKYLTHFVPEDPIYPEKPALKTAQALYTILEKFDSLESLQILQGDSTNTNTGWRGGSHALLEKLLGRKLFWGICNIHTLELKLKHLIASIDGPTCSDTGFTGPVCSLLSKVNEMLFNPSFKAMPGGEDIIEIPAEVVARMSTDQKVCYKLVEAVKSGHLPPNMQEMQCGPLSHARWLTTGESILFLWTRKHDLTGSNLKVLEMLVKFCLQWYFKLYFDIKVKHYIVDAPYHILTSLRILKTLPRKVQKAVTFYVRTGAWYAHSECLLLTLLSSSKFEDRKFAVDQILKLRGKNEYGDTSVRPRVTPKMNLSATSLIKLIKWEPGKVDEPVFTCSLSQEEIRGFLDKPLDPPKFSSHTQSTERCVKLVTEAAAAVCGQEARDGYIRARVQHREFLPVFTTKKHILATF